MAADEAADARSQRWRRAADATMELGVTGERAAAVTTSRSSAPAWSEARSRASCRTIRLRLVLLEAGHDVGAGTSKANTAILHTGFDAKPGTLEARLVRRGHGC